MLSFQAVALVISLVTFYVSGHPERPAIPDNPMIRMLFKLAEARGTPDGALTEQELNDLFTKFDLNADHRVTREEFMESWELSKIGSLVHGATLFRHLDTNDDEVIDRVPDLPRIFYYFDRNDDGKISEPEFQVVWYSLSA